MNFFVALEPQRSSCYRFLEQQTYIHATGTYINKQIYAMGASNQKKTHAAVSPSIKHKICDLLKFHRPYFKAVSPSCGYMNTNCH